MTALVGGGTAPEPPSARFVGRPAARARARLFRAAGLGLGALLAGFGALVLGGWVTRTDALTNPTLGLADLNPSAADVTMKPLTALWLLVLGMGIALACHQERGRGEMRGRHGGTGARRTQAPEALAVFALGTAILVECAHLLGGVVDLGPLAEPGSALQLPAAVSPFAIVPLAFGLLVARRRGWAVISQGAALLVAATCTLALVALTCGVGPGFFWGVFGGMAIHATLASAVGGVGVALVSADRAMLSLITGDSAGGAVGRRLLPVMVLVPAVGGFVTALGVRRGLFAATDGVAVLAMVVLVVGVALLWFESVQLRRVDVQRADAQASAAALRRALAERDALAATLTQVNGDLSAFAATVAHDLRAPLAVILSYVELVADLDLVREHEDAAAWVARITRAADRGSTLIDEVLAYAHAESAETDLVPVDLTAVLREVVADSAYAAMVTVADLPPVQGNRALLRQLMDNLVGNAIKYVPPAREPRVLVDAVRRGGRVVVRVADNGDGIPEADRERLFTMFQRGRDQTQPGNGVGLAICRRVVERHGGTIWIEDAPAGGAMLCVSLAPADGAPALRAAVEG